MTGRMCGVHTSEVAAMVGGLRAGVLQPMRRAFMLNGESNC